MRFRKGIEAQQEGRLADLSQAGDITLVSAGGGPRRVRLRLTPRLRVIIHVVGLLSGGPRRTRHTLSLTSGWQIRDRRRHPRWTSRGTIFGMHPRRSIGRRKGATVA